MHPRASPRGRLRAGELAEAVVLADLTLVLSIVSAVLPFGGPLLVIAVVPMAALAARNRLRAVIVGTVAASTVGFLVLGPPAITSVVGCSAIGTVVGYSARRDFGPGRTVGLAVVFLWPAVSAVVNFLLWVFPANRKLALAQVRNGWSGVARVVRWCGDRVEHVPLLRSLHLGTVADHGDRFIAHAIRDWWLTVPVVLCIIVVATTVLAQRIATPTLRRVRAAFAGDSLAVDDEHDVDGADATGAPAPVPVALERVGYRYPRAPSDSLCDISLEFGARELVAIVGPNGSGKSTLARVLAGRRPTTGAVIRPGAIGLGAPGGTAMVFQRPELQVLGVRVRDDIVWGLAPSPAVDVDALLDRVGLHGFADRETSTLSGGELQRLAIAAALARRPQLLISDESTAMVDEDGREQLVALLRSLVTDEGMAVVHVTHQASESDIADRVIALDTGRVVVAPRGAVAEVPRPQAVSPSTGDPLLVLRGVGHVYSARSPWAHRALADVNLRIDRGEAILVVGHNGSGKSTLAWILAGLLDPNEGEALLGGVRVSSVVGKVGVAFQHARLQLLRPTVGAEVSAASGASPSAAWRALSDIGFDPSDIAPRRVDELSGGEARRVVLASALAARPLALVLDEPFAGLDEQARADLTTALTRLRVEHGMTLVCVSHDRDLPAELVDREVELAGGRITYDGPPRITEVTDRDSGPGESVVTAATAPRREPELTFLRWVPGDSPVHRLWPGTKLLAAAELALAASIAPSWLTLGVISGIVLLGLLVARIPLGAFPRFPRGFYLLILFGLSLNALATIPKVVHLGPVPVSLGALAEASRFFALGIVLIVSAALVGWTTRLGTVAPTLSRLARPFRALRLPVDEWIVAIALALRCLPLLIDEMRTLGAARRLRHRVEDDRHTVRRAAVEVHDLVSTAIIVSLRRAHDLADAIVARGGIASIGDAQGSRFRWPDAVTLFGVTAVVAGLLVVWST